MASAETIPMTSSEPSPARIDPRQWDDLFGALAAPFAEHEVKALSKGGKKMAYITARTAMNRLDAVLGPANWWDDYTPGEHSVVCRLTIRLPDGSTLTKVDAGAYAGMADPGDDDKSGFSDALKRSAAKFGVARYLYGDGVASTPGAQPRPRERAGPPLRPGDWIARQVDRANARWREIAPAGFETTDIVNVFEVENHLANAFVKTDLATAEEIATNGKRDPRKVRDTIMRVWAQDRQVVQAEVQAKLKDKLAEAQEIDQAGPDEASDVWEGERE